MMVHRLVCDTFMRDASADQLICINIECIAQCLLFSFLEEDLSFENYEQDDTSNDHFITLESFEKGN